MTKSDSEIRYEHLYGLDCGDIWEKMKDGVVTLEDIEWYANQNAIKPNMHGNAGYHFRQLAYHYEREGQNDRATNLKKRAIEQLLLDNRAWEAALLHLEMGEINRVRELYPEIKKWDSSHTDILEKRIDAYLSGNPNYATI
jgi:hypothetical protein